MIVEYNTLLAADGWEVHHVKDFCGKPVFGYRRAIDSARPHLQEASASQTLSADTTLPGKPGICKMRLRKTRSLPSVRRRNFWRRCVKRYCVRLQKRGLSRAGKNHGQRPNRGAEKDSRTAPAGEDFVALQRFQPLRINTYRKKGEGDRCGHFSFSTASKYASISGESHC